MGFAAGDNGNPAPQVIQGCFPGKFAPPCDFDLPAGIAFGSTQTVSNLACISGTAGVSCVSSLTCGEGETCVNHLCQITGGTCEPGGNTQPCGGLLPACPTDEICVSGFCRQDEACTTSAQCSSTGGSCLDGFCTTGTGGGTCESLGGSCTALPTGAPPFLNQFVTTALTDFQWTSNQLPTTFATLTVPPVASKACAVGDLIAFPGFSFLNPVGIDPMSAAFPPGTFPSIPFPINDGSKINQPATIGGCNTASLLPTGVALDPNVNAIFAVQQGAPTAIPGFVTAYEPASTFTVCLFTGSGLPSVPPCDKIAVDSYIVLLEEPTPGLSGYGNVTASGIYSLPKALTPPGDSFSPGQLVAPQFIALAPDPDHDGTGVGYVTDFGVNNAGAANIPPQINVFSYSPSYITQTGAFSSLCPGDDNDPDTGTCLDCAAGTTACAAPNSAICCPSDCPIPTPDVSCVIGPGFFPPGSMGPAVTVVGGGMQPAGKITGSNTALQTPNGIAVGAELDDIYVANTRANKVLFFDLAAPVKGTQNISPQVSITGSKTRLNQPEGLTMNCFDDPTAPECLTTCTGGFNPVTGVCCPAGETFITSVIPGDGAACCPVGDIYCGPVLGCEAPIADGVAAAICVE
jgi:hypothetical protein